VFGDHAPRFPGRHADGDAPAEVYQCDYANCGQRFRSLHTYKAHQKVHNRLGNFQRCGPLLCCDCVGGACFVLVSRMQRVKGRYDSLGS
jgi:hypothetical protein